MTDTAETRLGENAWFEIEANLGDLTDHYERFKEIVVPIPAEVKVQIPWNEEVAKDKVADTLKKLSPDATFEDFINAIEAAKYNSVSARNHELLSNGFTGSIVGLFDRIFKVEQNKYISGEAQDETDTENGEESLLSALKAEISWYKQIPVEHQLVATFVSDRGYYFGGFFTPFDVEPDSSYDDHDIRGAFLAEVREAGLDLTPEDMDKIGNVFQSFVDDNVGNVTEVHNH